ncbi:unnamed protein product, partial [Brassica rapa subsp. trilocularis]
KQNAFLGTPFIYLDIQKTFHQYLHAYSGPKATPNVVGQYASSKEVIYITRTQIQRSSL